MELIWEVVKLEFQESTFCSRRLVHKTFSANEFQLLRLI